MSQVTMKQLLEAGVHFGHQTSRWNPKMRQYIFGARNGIHIIDLQQTVTMFRDACNFLQSVSARGGVALFVGTKKQAQEPVRIEAERSGQSYVNNRWLGGTLTNFHTIKQSIERLKKLEEILADDLNSGGFKKKELLMMSRECDKLRANLQGVRDMKRLPDVMFVIDPDREDIAVNEANRLGIPVVAVVDTNCDPDRISYCIPGNDDAIRAIRLFCQAAADALLAGVQEHDERSRAEADAAGLELGLGEATAGAMLSNVASQPADSDATPADDAAAAPEKASAETPAEPAAAAAPAADAESTPETAAAGETPDEPTPAPEAAAGTPK